jgi:hypothetical protein
LSLVLVLTVAGRQRSQAADRGAVQCVVIDTLSLAPTALEALAREAQDLFASAGVRTTWRRRLPGAPETDYDQLVIVLPEPPGDQRGSTLGAVPSTHETHAGWVYAGPVARALGYDWSAKRSWTTGEWLHFGQALGRVAAHELVHVFLPQLPHARSGLMRASFGGDELLRGTPRLDGNTRRALKDWFAAVSLAEGWDLAQIGAEAPARE